MPVDLRLCQAGLAEKQQPAGDERPEGAAGDGVPALIEPVKHCLDLITRLKSSGNLSVFTIQR